MKTFPSTPRTLGKHGRATWKLGQPLWRDGVVNEDNIHAWLRYCQLADEIEHCREVIERDGEYHKTKNGCVVQHPAINRKMELEKQLWRLNRDFGIVGRTAPTKKATQSVTKRER